MNKNKAIVKVDGADVEVEYWAELEEQWGTDGLNEFLFAEALKQLGKIAEAVSFLIGKAKGTLTKDANSGYVDTRNWQQNWIDSFGN